MNRYFSLPKSRLLLTAIILTFSGCSMFFGSSERDIKKDKAYSVFFNDEGWKKINPQDSDVTYTNQAGDILLANSFCYEFQSEPLDKLAKNTFQSINQSKIIEGKIIQFKEREAYEAIGAGSMDGVDIKIKLRNFRRNHCYYDLVLITNEINQSNLQSFDNFSDSIELK